MNIKKKKLVKLNLFNSNTVFFYYSTDKVLRYLYLKNLIYIWLNLFKPYHLEEGEVVTR